MMKIEANEEARAQQTFVKQRKSNLEAMKKLWIISDAAPDAECNFRIIKNIFFSSPRCRTLS